MKWISVKDKLPEFGIKHRYLFINGKGKVTYGYAYPTEEWVHGIWKTYSAPSIWINDMDRETNEIATHWMPLPKPPPDESHSLSQVEPK